MENKAREIAGFQIPEAGYQALALMLTPQEQALLQKMEADVLYGQRELDDMISTTFACTGEKIEEQKKQLYRRGVINQCEQEGMYTMGNFWSRLDIFATDEPQVYNRLPEKLRLQLEDMYLDRYISSLGPLTERYPTPDEILPIEDVYAFIDSKEETPYLAMCDCKSLRQACQSSRDLCITYRTGPWSYVRRGLAKAITKEEAKAIVARAEKEGLIHTVNPGGICSCCTDCCYLFRSAEVRGSLGVWPRVVYQVQLNEENCLACGKCVSRCHFGVFSKDTDKKTVTADTSLCQGCGLCVSACPGQALSLLRSGESLICP